MLRNYTFILFHAFNQFIHIHNENAKAVIDSREKVHTGTIYFTQNINKM